MADSNTEIKQRRGGKPFVKGDARINRKGRPKSFDKLRALAQQISHEPIDAESDMTRVEAILRAMAAANPVLFLEIAFGKVPNETKISGDEANPIKQVIEVVYVDTARTAPPARGATRDQADGETL